MIMLLILVLISIDINRGLCEDVEANVVTGAHNMPGDEVTPSFVLLNITLNQDKLFLKLDRNIDQGSEFPVYILTKDNAGVYHTDKVHVEKGKNFGLYMDVLHSAAFMIYQEINKNGKSHIRMEGIVHSRGNLYHVMNTERNSTTSQRFHENDSSSRYMNKTVNVRLSQEVDFFVRVLKHSSKSRYDAVLKPGSTETSDEIRLPVTRQRAARSPDEQQINPDVNVDVVAIVDFAIYSRWHNRSTSTQRNVIQHQDILAEIQQYFALVFNGVNMLYKSITELPYTIHVRLSSIIVSMNASSSIWTEPFRESSSPWDEVNADFVLNSLSKWASTTSTLPSYDHLMLFTGYDFIRIEDNETSDSIAGLAYIGTACKTNGLATSVVEDLGGFECIGIAAHELGHGLSAEHDGKNNNCSEDDRFIMSPGYSEQTEENKLNPWKFSSCSVTYFDSYIKRTLLGERRDCMLNTLSSPYNLPNVSSILPGQVYNATEQCRQKYGTGSYVCQNIQNWKPSDACTLMFCKNPDSDQCSSLNAAQGTSCGNKKWCIDGECVYDIKAPAMEGCEFGDRVPDCNKTLCYGYIYMRKCCGTCNYSEPTVTSNDTSIFPGQMFDVNEQCRQAFGSGSYVCQHISDWNASNVCSSMYCHDPRGDPSLCYGITAEERTTCGHKQWCLNGRCVFDKDAPEVDDACILGDDLDPKAFFGGPCSNLFSYSPQCSEAYIRERCCQTCDNLILSSFVKSTITSTRTALHTVATSTKVTFKPNTTIVPTRITTKPTTTTIPTTTTKPTTTVIPITTTKPTTTAIPTTTTKPTTTAIPTTTTKPTTTAKPTTIPTTITKTTNIPTTTSKPATTQLVSNYAGHLETVSSLIILIAVLATLNCLKI